MKQSFFLNALIAMDDDGRAVAVDLEQTNTAMNHLLLHIQGEGFTVESITPVTAGRNPAGNATGYSYTSGFLILASKPLEEYEKDIAADEEKANNDFNHGY